MRHDRDADVVVLGATAAGAMAAATEAEEGADTYEGDLLRSAGVSHAIGREGRERYGEPLAGRVELLPSPDCRSAHDIPRD